MEQSISTLICFLFSYPLVLSTCARSGDLSGKSGVLNFMKYIRDKSAAICDVVHCLYENNGSVNVEEALQLFSRGNYREGLSGAIDAGYIINEHGRFYLHPRVFINLATNRTGVAC